MCLRRVAKASLRRKGPTAKDVLTLSQLAHPCAAVLSMWVRMCNNGAILGERIRIFMRSAPRSRLLIVTSPVGLEKHTRNAWVAVEKGECQKKYWPSGYRQTPPMLVPEALVDPIQVGRKGSSSLKFFGLLSRILTK